MATTDRVYLAHGIGTVIAGNEANRMKVRVYHLGPCLAYSMNKTGATEKGREKVEYLISSGFLSKGSVVITCFGEIDIRSHILKPGRMDFSAKLDAAICGYVEFIRRMASDFKVVVCGPIATQKDIWRVNKLFPRYGTEQERNKVTGAFNGKLQNLCSELDIPFVTFFYEMIDENMQTKDGFIFDECHLHSAYHEEMTRRLGAVI